LQALFIYFDKDIWYEKTDQATLARTWNLSDDLGQIEYIFSDKTGTLTQNSMVFRQCSIGGKVYQGDDVPPDDKRASSQDSTLTPQTKKDDHSEDTPDPLTAKPPIPKESKFYDATLAADLSAAGNPSANDDGSFPRILNGFFSVLALCHTVLSAVDPTTGAIEYRAQSPDEAALVQAAADVGYIFRGREREILNLQTPFSDTIERYELLNILDFTSARKRMSVIVRRVDNSEGRVFLLCKGADNVIFERLKKGKDEELRKVTEKHLDEFASQGLRTLTLAFKAIPGICVSFLFRCFRRD
jgi:phospholipid-translocating ATPase